jgi:hypothetical protein
MDLSLVTVEQILDELEKRGLEFSLVLSRDTLGQPQCEQPDYELYSSFEDPLHQSVHLLLASVSILGTLMEQFEEAADTRTEEVRGWVDSGEAMLNDLMRAAQKWAEQSE